MTQQDIINLSLAVLAVLISLGTAIYTALSYSAGRDDQRRTMRIQLTDVLKQIFETNFEMVKQAQELQGKDPVYADQIGSMLSQQNATLLSQAMFLADQVKHLVSTPEYIMLAQANAEAGDYPLANKYAERAIEVAPSKENHFRAIATRIYANILFTQEDPDKGRAQFETAITLFQGADNLNHFQRGYTYLDWATNERVIDPSGQRADELFTKAEEEYNKISVQVLRSMKLAELQKFKATPPSPIEQTRLSQNFPLQPRLSSPLTPQAQPDFSAQQPAGALPHSMLGRMNPPVQ